MILKLALIVASPFLALTVLVGATGVVTVDVRETAPDNVHIAIPVPLALAQVALAFAPDEAKYIRCPEFARYQDVAAKILRELEHAPDGVLVEVHDGAENVRIVKKGGVLEVNVQDAAGESVECRLPLKAARKAVESYDGEGFSTKSALWALRHAPKGTLVHVKDGSDEVTIRLL